MARIDLIGILEDGSSRSQRLPGNARKQINTTVSASLTIGIQVFQSNAVPVDLSADASLMLSMKRSSYLYGLPLIKVDGVFDPSNGLVRNAMLFTITPAMTRFLVPGRYVYDVWLIRGEQRDAVVPLSPFILGPSALMPYP